MIENAAAEHFHLYLNLSTKLKVQKRMVTRLHISFNICS